MAKKKKATGSWTIARIRDLSPEEASKLKKSEMQEVITAARRKVDTRMKSLSREESKTRTFYSHELHKMEKYYEAVPRKNLDGMSRNQMFAELWRIQEFFQAESSSVAKTRKILMEQDKRIFAGTDKPGRRMTKAEREMYWSIYDEFNRSYNKEMVFYQSGKVQQTLADAILDAGFEEENFGSILQDLRTRLEEDTRKNEVPDYARTIFASHRHGQPEDFD